MERTVISFPRKVRRQAVVSTGRWAHRRSRVTIPRYCVRAYARQRFSRSATFTSIVALTSYVNVEAREVQRQPFDVLSVLVAARGNVVTRDGLREVVWGRDTHVDFERGIADSR
jgi:DNA-binding response OmpR family regulator